MARRSAAPRPTAGLVSGPKVKWIKITDYPGDSSQKKVYFETSQGLISSYYYFIINDPTAPEMKWVETLMVQYLTGGELYCDPTGGISVTYDWSDEYSVVGPGSIVSAPNPAPAHQEATNVRTVP